MRLVHRLEPQMQIATPKKPPLPLSLKVAIGLFAVHLFLYAEGIFESYSSGHALHLMWFGHLIIAGYAASMIPRPEKVSLLGVVAYCVIIAANMLRVEYIADAESDALLSAMSRTIVTTAPLLLAAVAVLISRKYYFSAAASTENTAQTSV